VRDAATSAGAVLAGPDQGDDGDGVEGRIMTKRQPSKATERPKKRGPKGERLVISEDPEIALAKLLRPTTKKAR